DPTENCTGASPACPADIFLPSTTVCRSAADECDVAESCTGTAGACPADQKKSSGTGCIDDGNPCTLDQCDGAGDPCQHPAGNAGTVCRTSAGVCDVAESCDGASITCPPDGFASASTVCRGAADNCDVAESCTGFTTACPPDLRAPDGTPCNDANSCTVSDSCQSGVCTGTPSGTPQCGDHYLCYKVQAGPLNPGLAVHLV